MFESMGFQGLTDAQSEIIAYWNNCTKGAGIPRRKDIDPGALRAHLAAISIVELEPSGDVRFRIAGSGLRDIFGKEMRGQRLSDLSSDVADMWSLGLAAAIERNVPTGGMIDRTRDKHTWLRLPLYQADGPMAILCHDVLFQKTVRADEPRKGFSNTATTLAA